MYPTTIRIAQVKNIVNLSRSSIYAMVRKGEFPPSIKLGPRAVAWIESEVHGWVADRIKASRPDSH